MPSFISEEIFASAIPGFDADTFIRKARSDDGRIQYWPIHDGRRIIDGRDAWRGNFVGSDGRQTDEVVSHDLWQAACKLADAVEAHNDRVNGRARSRQWAREGDHEAFLDWIAVGGRGHAYDPRTY